LLKRTKEKRRGQKRREEISQIRYCAARVDRTISAMHNGE